MAPTENRDVCVVLDHALLLAGQFEEGRNGLEWRWRERESGLRLALAAPEFVHAVFQKAWLRRFKFGP